MVMSSSEVIVLTEPLIGVPSERVTRFIIDGRRDRRLELNQRIAMAALVEAPMTRG